MDDSETYYYAKGAFTRLDYLKLPVYAFFNQEIGHESGLFLKVIAGFQFSLNTDYYGELKQFYFDGQTRTVLIDSTVYSIIYKPAESYFNDFRNNNSSNTANTKYLFRYFELGALAGLVLQKRIFESYTISFGLRYELGLTNIENPDEDKHIVTFSGLTGSGGLPDPRPVTQNRRLMLNIGISRIIE